MRSDLPATARYGRASPAHALAALRAQERFREAVGDQASAQGCFAILLFLYSHRDGDPVATATCCAAAPAPRTTALRWIKTLADAKLVIQQQDAADRRVTAVSLSARAADLVREWLMAVVA